MATYNHRLIEVTGIVTHGFEYFMLSDAICASPLGIWIEYGGTKASPTTFCCEPTANARRSGTVQVEGIAVPLETDKRFREFDRAMHGDASVRATMVGRFFLGAEQRLPNGRTRWGGYGHLGCCSLLVIQRVLQVHSPAR